MRIYQVVSCGKKSGNHNVYHVIASSKSEAEDKVAKKLKDYADNFYFTAMPLEFKDFDYILVPKGEGM